ncbi:MAG: DNA-3-methyladenine glycosylase, partial [Ignavibacteriales bacterium]|nr:DNA-3-methyladenine glycosylase [Ignavibacteriales bacterium]
GRAVLLRAVEPIDGIKVMMKNRHHKRSPPKADGVLESACGGWSNGELINLTNGPAKLCEAFGLKREQNGTDLLGDDIYLTDDEHVELSKIQTSKRMGITNGTDKKWRFYIKDNPFVLKNSRSEAEPPPSNV